MGRQLYSPEDSHPSPQGSTDHENSSSLGVWELWGKEHKCPFSLLRFEAAWAACSLWNAHGLEKQPVLLASCCQEHAQHQPYFFPLGQKELNCEEEAAWDFHTSMSLLIPFPCSLNAVPRADHSSLLENVCSSFNTSNRNSSHSVHYQSMFFMYLG